MRLISRLKFQTKILLGMILILAAVALMTAIPVSRMAARAILAESRGRGLALSENLSLRLADAMLTQDFLRMKTMVDELTAVGDDVIYAFVQDESGNVLAHTFQKGFPVELRTVNAPVAPGQPGSPGPSVMLLDIGTGLVYDYAVPVVIDDRRLGTARLGLSRDRAEGEVRRLLMAFGGFSAAALAAALILSSMFARRVARRINALKEYAQEVVRGNLDIETASTLKRNCWEIMNCARTDCPAYGKPRHRCWHMHGTLCPDCAPADKQGHKTCQRCPVFRANSGDEIQDLAETFGIMAMTLKRQMGKLGQQEQLMRTILDATPDLVCLLDAQGRFLAVNRAFAAALGRTEWELSGLGEGECFDPEEAAARVAQTRAVLESGREAQVEGRLHSVSTSATLLLHELHVPVRDASGAVIGVLKTARDVTGVKAMEATLLQAQKMESIGKLAGGVAHEINTPLGIILGYAQLLQEDVPEGQVREDLRIMERQAKACRKIVADLLGFSRQHESSMVPMDVNASLSEVASLVRHTFGLDQVTVELDLEPGLPPVVGDREKLGQVWINLLNNARDAMPGGGTVLARTRRAGNVVEVCVADGGTGISREHLDKIFDPFFSTKGVGEGTGLGLSVSFGIVQNHGGTIEVASPAPPELLPSSSAADESGPGTVFRVLLPAGADSPPVAK